MEIPVDRVPVLVGECPCELREEMVEIEHVLSEYCQIAKCINLAVKELLPKDILPDKLHDWLLKSLKNAQKIWR